MNSKTVIIPVSITIVNRMILAKTSDLAFGKLVPSFSAGTLTISPITGTRSVTGGVKLFVQGNTTTRAQYLVTGTNAYTYSITLPTTATLTSGVNTMTVNNFISSPVSPGQLTTGSQILYVGGTLNVNTNQPIGGYSGFFSVSVDYN